MESATSRFVPQGSLGRTAGGFRHLSNYHARLSCCFSFGHGKGGPKHRLLDASRTSIYCTIRYAPYRILAQGRRSCQAMPASLLTVDLVNVIQQWPLNPSS